ncbi:MAG TPA: dynamin family protein [Thermoanaerobaculia bacterium]|nr:dynamin family protein [Thermoanaerobaculia bacterium]
MVDTRSQLDAFQESRLALARLAARLAAAAFRLGSDSRAETLCRLGRKLESERFRILVIGELKRGKSTLVNALLGEEVLPTDAVPCTAVIQEIRWGEERRAVLHFRYPLPAPLPEALPPNVAVHLGLAEDGPVPPLEVPIDRLADYAVIQDGEAGGDTPYAKVEIFWPLALCRHGIEVIDSPGLNESDTRTRVTRDYIPEADAILFVLSSSALGAATEMHLHRDLREVGHQYLFYVCNRLDEIRASERERLVSFGKAKLAGLTELGDSGIWFVSAIRALEGKRTGDAACLEGSGLPAFERALLDFLQRERGRVKLLQPTLRVLQSLDELRNKLLPEQCEMLEEDLAVLEARIAAARPQLAEVERTHHLILADLKDHRQRLRTEVRLLAEAFLRGVAAQIADWIDGFKLENGIRTVSLQYAKQVEALAEEVSAKVDARLEAELSEWKEKSLVPLVNARVETMLEDVSVQVDEACFRVDQIRGTLTRVRFPVHAVEEPSEQERIAAALGGFFLAGLSGGAHGARFGFKGLGASVLTQVALYAILYGLLGITNPLILGPVLLSASLGFAWSRAGRLTREAKQGISRSLTAQIHGNVEPAAQGLADAVYERTEELVYRTTERLEQEIRSLREQMQTILEDKRAGEERVRARQEMLVAVDRELREIDGAFHPFLALALVDRGVPRSSTRSGFRKGASTPVEQTLRILFLATDPPSDLRDRLRLDRELREILEQKGLARLRDRMDLRSETAVRSKDVTRALQNYDAHIVHFSGHGTEAGAILVETEDGEDHPIQPEALASLFDLFADHVDCVILNACYSDLQARAVSQKIRYVVGMQSSIHDESSIAFSIGFYQALGAGRSIEDSFTAGRVLMGMEDWQDSQVLTLWKNGVPAGVMPAEPLK